MQYGASPSFPLRSCSTRKAASFSKTQGLRVSLLTKPEIRALPPPIAKRQSGNFRRHRQIFTRTPRHDPRRRSFQTHARAKNRRALQFNAEGAMRLQDTSPVCIYDRTAKATAAATEKSSPPSSHSAPASPSPALSATACPSASLPLREKLLNRHRAYSSDAHCRYSASEANRRLR